MSDEFWDLAKQFGTNKKPMAKGFLLKSDFCRKYKISIIEFDNMLLESGNKLKNGLMLSSSNIKKRSGTWCKGVFQYREKYFSELVTNK